MFENILKFFKKTNKQETLNPSSKETAKERLHLVLMQDRANVSADFLDLMRQEIIEVIKKYIDIDESAMDVRLTNQANEDGTQGAPALYANIPILNIKDESRKINNSTDEKDSKENKIEKDDNNSNVSNDAVENNIDELKQTSEHENMKTENTENITENENNNNVDKKEVIENSTEFKDVIIQNSENTEEKKEENAES